MSGATMKKMAANTMHRNLILEAMKNQQLLIRVIIERSENLRRNASPNKKVVCDRSCHVRKPD